MPTVYFDGLDQGPGPYNFRIRTLQSHIVGDAPDFDCLIEWYREAGFERASHLRVGAYDSVTLRRNELWLFDVRPMNFKVDAEGRCYPIDVIVQLDPDAELATDSNFQAQE